MYFNEAPSDFAIFRWKNGVKLMPIEHVVKNSIPSVIRANEILNLPFNIYFVDAESRMCNASNTCLENMGFSSLQDGRRKTMLDISPKESAAKILQIDKEVIMCHRAHICDDHVTLHNKTELDFITMKFPWYDVQGEIKGVLGFSALIDEHSLADYFIQLQKFDLISPTINEKLSQAIQVRRYINGIYLTQRQANILYQTVKGKQAKEIASIYGISVRTVEEKIEYLKKKFNVYSKNDLIEKILDSDNSI